LLVLDLGLPSTAEGLWVLSEARRFDPDLKILVFSASSSMVPVHRSLIDGVDGFVEKTAPWGELIQALRCVRDGQKYFGSKIGERLVEAIKCEGQGSLLSTKEIVLLRFLAEGRVAKAIAEEMAVSVPSIYRDIQTVRAKLNASTNEEILRKAFTLGYLEIAATPTSASLGDEPRVTRPKFA
jgi:DNA-binding NarL/FixJ family response regulator